MKKLLAVLVLAAFALVPSLPAADDVKAGDKDQPTCPMKGKAKGECPAGDKKGGCCPSGGDKGHCPAGKDAAPDKK